MSERARTLGGGERWGATAAMAVLTALSILISQGDQTRAQVATQANATKVEAGRRSR